MSLPAATEDTLPVVAMALPSFRLEPGERLAVGLRRLSLREIESAVSGFYDGEEFFGHAVHEARKSMKRIRALLRLVRFEIGEKAYRFENLAMRDTARMVSDVRSSAVAVETVSGVRRLYGALLAEQTFEELQDRLEVRRDRIELRAMEDPDLVPRVVANLEKAHARYAAWPTDPGAREVYGVGIRESFEAIGPGLRHTYRRGRREMVAAYRSPTPHNFHWWRKRVKYLRHQLEILVPVWPEVMLGMALTVERIGELLGEDHDLAELVRVLQERPDLCPDPLERSLLRALAAQRRDDLETASRILGRRIFAESPDDLVKRIGAYWESMEMARDFTLASIRS